MLSLCLVHLIGLLYKCMSLLCVCFVVGFWFYCRFFVFLCCSILLTQSQSLSRRTAPFPPRVQVMGPPARAFYWSTLLDCWHGLSFLFPYSGKCIPWEMAALTSLRCCPSCHLIAFNFNSSFMTMVIFFTFPLTHSCHYARVYYCMPNGSELHCYYSKRPSSMPVFLKLSQ